MCNFTSQLLNNNRSRKERMNRIGLIGLLTLTTVLVAKGQAFDYSRDYRKILKETGDPRGKFFYDTLRDRFLRDDGSLTREDVLALQIGFTQKDGYDPYGDIDLDRAFVGSTDREDTDTTVWYGAEYLKRNPVSLSANFALWKAYEKRNEIEVAEKYKFRFQRLVESILSTGDGVDRPFFVVSPIDGQIVIRKYWNADIGIMGSTHDKKKNFLDMLEMQKPDGTSKTLYFVIEHAVKRMWR
jgi:Domain of unknown function (DUF4919)